MSAAGGSDAEFLGLRREAAGEVFGFVVEPHLARLDGQLYGGTAIAASITAAELVSDRPAVWMTTQFVATAPGGSHIRLEAEVLAPGRRTNQVRVTGTDESGAVMFASLGATGHRRDGGLAGAFEHRPEVGPPLDSRPSDGPFAAMLRRAGVDAPPLPPGLGFNAVVEYREPELRNHPDAGPGRSCMWVRRRDGRPVTAATVAFMADMVPLAVAEGCGVVAGGISLDNTIRLGAVVPCEWVLLDLRAHLADGDYGHGTAHVWSEDGLLMATASQTAAMMRFDLTQLPWHDRGD